MVQYWLDVPWGMYDYEGMNQWLRLGIVVIILGIILSAIFFVLDRQAVDVPQGDQFTVAATIFPLADLVQQVGGEHVQVVLLIPPGVTEHSSALNPRQLAGVAQARTIFAIGSGLDNQLTERLQHANNIPVTEVSVGIQLHEFTAGEGHDGAEADEHDQEGIDPHYWLTVPNAQQMVRTITATLSELGPAHASDFAANATEYNEQLAGLEKELQAQAAALTQRHFIAMHDAWSYFARHYGLELVATYEPTEGKQPSPADLQHFGEVIREHTIKTFFAEPQKASTSATGLLEREFGLRISVLDPVGGVEPGDSYEKMMRRNMEAIVAGQE